MSGGRPVGFPDNLPRHRQALLELLEESYRLPGRRGAVRTRGISMAPFLIERDEVVLEARPLEAVRVGDLIAFKAPDALVVHRVAAIGRHGGEPVFYEKGDNNMYLSPVAARDVLAVAVEVVAGKRRLPLEAPRFRRLGLWVAWAGLRVVVLFDLARKLGRRLRPGSLPRRLGRRAAYFLLQLPIRIPLVVARRLL